MVFVSILVTQVPKCGWVDPKITAMSREQKYLIAVIIKERDFCEIFFR